MSFEAGKVIEASMADVNEPDFGWAEKDSSFFNWLNEALSRICMIVEPLEAGFYYDVDDGDKKFNTPENFVSLDSLQLNNEEIFQSQIYIESHGMPRENSITYDLERGMSETPVVVMSEELSSDDTLFMRYAILHPQISDVDNEIILSRMYFGPLVEYLNARFEYKDASPQEWQTQYQQWKQDLRTLVIHENTTMNSKGARAINKLRR